MIKGNKSLVFIGIRQLFENTNLGDRSKGFVAMSS